MTSSAWLLQHVSGIEPREYQREAWDKLWQLRADGGKRALICLATGLGKTTVAAVDVLHFIEEQPSARILFVSHVNEISQQALRTFVRFIPSLTTEFYQAKRPRAQAVFATFQALHRNLADFAADDFDYIIWDETHHIEAATFKAVREHFTPKFELGLTATPERGDGRDITTYFGEPLYNKELGDAMAEGWLSPVDYHLVFDDTLKKAIINGFDVESITELRALFKVKVRDEKIAEEVAKRRKQIGLEHTKTIVFCSSITHAGEIAKLLGGKAYHGSLSDKKRDKILTDFKNGSLETICTVDMFNEGIDIPETRLVVFLRSTSSKTIFEQQLGRGLRKHPGKDKVTILDFVANIERIQFVRELGRHINRKEYAGRREGTGVSRSASHIEYSFGNFDFDDLAIQLLDKYSKLKDAYPPMPQGYLSTEEAASHIGVTRSVLRRVIDRNYVPDNYRWYLNTANGHRMLGLSPDQVRALETYIKERVLPQSQREQAIALYRENESGVETARQLGISTTAVYNYLRKAGIERVSGMYRATPIELIESMYKRLGSCGKVARELGVDSNTIRTRLRNIGYEFEFYQTPTHEPEVMEAAYLRHDRKLRETAKELGISHYSLGTHLRRMGYITNRNVVGKNKATLIKLLRKHNGSAPAAADELGLTVRSFYNKCAKAGIKIKEFQKSFAK
jgi:superfamily II DNA or RNA helicase